MRVIERDYAELAAAVRHFGEALTTKRVADINARRAEVGEKITALAEQHRGAVEENRKLRALIESHPGAAAGSREYDWVVKAKGWLTDHPAGGQ